MSHTLRRRPRQAALLAALLTLAATLPACSNDASVTTLLAEAKQYQQKGDQKAALIQLKNAVAKSPDNGEARFLLSEQYVREDDFVSAEKEIRRAMANGIAPQRTMPILGKALLGQRQFQKVLDEIPADAAKSSAVLLTMRGDALLALKESDKARAAYQQALALSPNLGEALMGMARYSMVQNDNEAATRYTNEALVKDAKNPEVWMFQAMLFRSREKAEEAVGAYTRALALNPAHRSAALERAQLEVALGKYDAAKADLASAEKITPGSLGIVYTQALLDFNQGQYAAARDNLLKVEKIAPDYLPAVLLSGAVNLKLGSTQQAAKNFRQYLLAYPDHVNARRLLAQSLLKDGDTVEAGTVIAPLVRDPGKITDVDLLQLAAEVAMRNKDYNRASTLLERALALSPKSSTLHTSMGLARLGMRDAVRGVSELEQATTLDPASATAASALIKARVQLHQYDAALASLKTYEAQHPQDPQIPELLGSIYQGKGDLANARASFEKALAAKPDNVAMAAQLAQLDFAEKKPEQAKKRFESILTHDKKNITAMTALAEMALARRDIAEATSWLEKAMAENPNSVAPSLSLARLYLQTGEQAKALNLMRKLQAASQTDPETLDLLGQAQLQTGDKDGALDSYSKLVAVAPKSANAYMRLASVRAMMGNFSAAEDDLKRAASLDPASVPVRMGLAQMAMKRQKPDEALAIVRAIQALPGQAAAGLALEGELFLAQNKPAPAMAALEKSFGMNANTDVLLKLAVAMRQNGKAKEAEARVLKWQQANPNDLQVLMFLAEQSMSDKQNALAISRFEAIAKRFPDNLVALNNLALLYQQEKDARALPTAQKAVAAAPNNPAVLDTLGWMLVEQGNSKEGVQVLQKATTLAPNAGNIRYHLAVALNNTGDKTTARKELEKLLAGKTPFGNIDAAKALLKTL